MTFKNRFLSLTFFLSTCTFLVAQNSEYRITVGLGASLVQFSDVDAQYIGDKHLLQIPRIHVTGYVKNGFSLDASVELTTFTDFGVIENTKKYVSIGGAVRYDFNRSFEKLVPYVFIGGSLVDASVISTPTINIGAGTTYWFSDSWGVNTQGLYKYSLESFESMRSHMQYAIGFVYSLDF